MKLSATWGEGCISEPFLPLIPILSRHLLWSKHANAGSGEVSASPRNTPFGVLPEVRTYRP